VINLIWGSSFKRAYKKAVRANPDLKDKVAKALETFVTLTIKINDPISNNL